MSGDVKDSADNTSPASRRDTRAAAVCFCAVVVAGFTVYWVLQIQAVREMLKLAYG